MSTRRKLITSIASITAVGISGCLGGDDPNNSSGATDETSSNENTNQNLSNSESLLQSYEKAYQHHVNGSEHIKQALQAFDNGNHTESRSQFEKAEEDYRSAMNDYGPNQVQDLAMKVFGVDNVEDLPTVHRESMKNIIAGHKGMSLGVTMYEKAESEDTDVNTEAIDKIRTEYNAGRYSMADIEEFRQALP